MVISLGRWLSETSEQKRNGGKTEKWQSGECNGPGSILAHFKWGIVGLTPIQ